MPRLPAGLACVRRRDRVAGVDGHGIRPRRLSRRARDVRWRDVCARGGRSSVAARVERAASKVSTTRAAGTSLTPATETTAGVAASVPVW